MEVRIKAKPLRLYVADYDRVFRLHDEGDRRRRRFSHNADEGNGFWDGGWDHVRDDDTLAELREDHADDLNVRGIYSRDFAGVQGDLRTMVRRQRERRIAALERKLLLDQRPRQV